jgi:7-keto-8-aminopelargonate synthetase-like enzyme
VSVLDADLAPTAGREFFVMGYEHDRHVGLVVQLVQQICDKKRIGTVEAPGRLIRQQQQRLIGNGSRDRDPLKEQPRVSFSTNNYLGIATSPRTKAAAIRGIEAYGVGNSDSRLLGGNLALYG